MNDPSQSVRGYNRLARIYRWLELLLFPLVLPNDLQRARVAMLDKLPHTDSALVLGDGDGRFLQQLCHAQCHCKVTSVDQSEEMLRLQRQRVGESGRVTFLCQDARDFRPAEREYDLLVAPFFLDCFTEEELMRCLPQWLGGVRPGGMFYFVDFRVPRSRWSRIPASICLLIMHVFFRWQTGLPNRQLVDINAVLAREPITVVASQVRNGGMIQSTLYRVSVEP